MKKLILIFIALTVFFNVDAQKKNDLINSQVAGLLYNSLNTVSYDNGIYKFCSEFKETDDNQELKLTQKSKTTIFIKNNKSLINESTVQYNSEGDSTFYKLHISSSHGFINGKSDVDFQIPDTSLIFQKYNESWWPLYLSHAVYKNNLLKKVIYNTDMGLFFGDEPTGLIKNAEANYFYKNGKVKYKITTRLNFDSGNFEKADSVCYYYGDKTITEISYLYNPDSLKFFPYEKYTYEYDDKENLITKKEYFGLSGQWFLQNKISNNYDAKNRIISSLTEYSTFGDSTKLKPDFKESYVYDNPELYLDFYNKKLTETYDDGKWQMHSVHVNVDCGSVVAKTKDLAAMNFNARFEGDRIIINASEMTDKKVVVRLVDLQGRIIINKEYHNLPHYLQTYNLPSGLYMLNVKTKDKYGTIKLVKE